ncbi:RING-15 protein [Anopheles sinensis]|uniref:RING-15 protein n=1 Tax=Anopheles sinensis TaxID=74873 RepID=A0A084VEE5_ANOSI|nr:RING-15 protein [Anopheles sinensis]
MARVERKKQKAKRAKTNNKQNDNRDHDVDDDDTTDPASPHQARSSSAETSIGHLLLFFAPPCIGFVRRQPGGVALQMQLQLQLPAVRVNGGVHARTAMCDTKGAEEIACRWPRLYRTVHAQHGSRTQ